MLPTEVWIMILEYLEPHELYMAQFMSKAIYIYFQKLPNKQMLKDVINTYDISYIKKFTKFAKVSVKQSNGKDFWDKYVDIYHPDKKEEYSKIKPMKYTFYHNKKVILTKYKYIAI